ncbi:pyruvate formate lyase family protein [Methanobrevibacter sp.]|uniref:pyruvate formate lyase family protein n=1 Tax=Methanobrevibacter sp. TaxID=66852 RepID=UPI002E78FA15|nr:pyruvate formate lyase family protein [Methanobrevibacter sp.]MEE0025259.1 pyruvate formate lyase family protein [Methanobrevibacter sp.]
MVNLMINFKSILLKLGIFEYAKKILIFKSLSKKLDKYDSGNIFKKLHNFYTPSLKQTKGKQIQNLFTKININIPKNGFIFTLDPWKCLSYENRIIGNITMDYSKILNNSIDDLKLRYDAQNEFSSNQLDLLKAFEILIDREIDELKLSNREDKFEYINYLENIKFKKAKSFKEALQRILFFNQMLWQTNHHLNGVGRLDLILNDLYEKDNISKNEAYELIKDFIIKIHSYYYFKSDAFAGDTGQIIVLGGLNENNDYFYNDLTYLFMDALKELNLPDPKIILRYSDKMPNDLMDLAVETMATGIGSPLLSNDDLIIKKLIEFGYKKEDAYNYVVSACWEPAPLGRGLELNNVNLIIFLKPLNELLDNEDLSKYSNFNEFFDDYKIYLKNYVNEILNIINSYSWEEDPIISLFIENDNKDVSKGSSVYNNYGLTSVSLSNTVNSLYNIKKLVFEDGKYSFEALNESRKANFQDEILLNELKCQKKFGMDDLEIIKLTNEVTCFVDDIFKSKNTRYGGKFKFGLSAPSYISGSLDVRASLDGRKDYEPFNVHISLDDNKDYTEIMHFASKLDYNNHKFNGNVVDFMVAPDFIEKNFNKFSDFLKMSLNIGVFQMQLNVVSSKILIDAQKHPERYPNLIVRVWGFSSYFKDLPIEYQDILIKRACANENLD